MLVGLSQTQMSHPVSWTAYPHHLSHNERCGKTLSSTVWGRSTESTADCLHQAGYMPRLAPLAAGLDISSEFQGGGEKPGRFHVWKATIPPSRDVSRICDLHVTFIIQCLCLISAQ